MSASVHACTYEHTYEHVYLVNVFLFSRLWGRMSMTPLTTLEKSLRLKV